MLAILTLSPFLIMPVVLWLGRYFPLSRLVRRLAWLSLAIIFGSMMRTVVTSGPVTSALPWAESLGLTLSFYGDGLSLLFATMITAIGALIVLFSSRYFDGDPRAGALSGDLVCIHGLHAGRGACGQHFCIICLLGINWLYVLFVDRLRPGTSAIA